MNGARFHQPAIALLLLATLLLATLAWVGWDAVGRDIQSQHQGENDVTAEDLRAVEQSILKETVSEFNKMALENQVNYDAENAPKAAAICRIPLDRNDGKGIDFLYFGAAWEWQTLEEASQRAIRRCNEEKDNPRAREWARLGVILDCKCELLFQNSTVVLVPPKEMVIAKAKRLSGLTIPTLCPERFNSKRRVVDTKLTCLTDRENLARMDFVINRVGDPNSTSPDIFPGAPVVSSSAIKARHITDSAGRLIEPTISFYPPVGDLYVETPYRLPTGWRYRFHLHQVPLSAQAGVQARLNSLEPSKLYGKFSQKKITEPERPSLNSSQIFAKYIRAYDLSDDEAAQALDFPEFPEHGLNGVRGERSRKLWVEAFIPIDDDWVPVGAPLRRVVPIALETTASLYLFSIEVEAAAPVGGGTFTRFEGRIFDLSGCGRVADCFREVQRSFTSALSAEFSAPPLSASLVTKPMPPHQIRFQRAYEPSQVLEGLAG